jgi:hypothetical protein
MSETTEQTFLADPRFLLDDEDAAYAIAALHRAHDDWGITSLLIRATVPRVTFTSAQDYWNGAPLTDVLADHVVQILGCPPVRSDAHAKLLEGTAEWTREESRLEAWTKRS